MADEDIIVQIRADVSDLSVQMQAMQADFAASMSALQDSVVSASETLRNDLTKSADEAKQHIIEMGEESANVGEHIESLKAGIEGIGKATGIVVAIEAFKKMGEEIEHITAGAIELRNLSDVLNLDVEAAQALKAASEEAGVSMSLTERASLRLSENLKKAQEGSGDAREALMKLGLSLGEASSHSTTLTDILERVHARLTDTSTASKETAELAQLLGAREAEVAEVFKTFSASAEGVAEKDREINALTKEQTQALVELGGWWKTVEEYAGNTVKSLVADVLMLNASNVITTKGLEQQRDMYLQIAHDNESNPTGTWALKQAEDAEDLIDKLHGVAAATKEVAAATDSTSGPDNAGSLAAIAAVGRTTEAFKSGTAERVRIAQQFYELTAQQYGEDSDKAQAAYAKVLEAQRAFTDRSAELSKQHYEREDALYSRSAADRRHEMEEDIAAKQRDDDEILNNELKTQEAEAKATLDLATLQIDAAQKVLAAELAAKQISPSQFNALEIELIREKQQAQERYYAALSALRSADDAAQVQYLADQQKAVQTADAAILQMQQKAAADVEKNWQQITKPIEQSFTSALDGMLKGTETFKSATLKLFDGIALDFVNGVVHHMVTSWLEAEAAKLAASHSATAVLNALHLQNLVSAKTTAAAQGASQINSDAAVAAAGAYAATALIPYVGPIIAPAAAADAEASVLSFLGQVASAAGGMVVDRDQLAMIHQDEMVLPRHISQGIQEKVINGPEAAASAGNGKGDTYHIHAHDTDGFDKFVNKKANRNAIMKSVRKAYNSGNRSVR